MGGSVSAGRNNDELIDHLVEAEFIRTPLVQQVFRAVDRGNYYCLGQRHNAYRDMSWRMGNLHLSAPCIYSVVMEALNLKPGLSFLNLGSGTGYFSTMAGLILGPYGINHGIELHKDVVDFAYERLNDFIGNANAIDEYDFCEPSFFVGNCLLLDNSCQQYDRVYCGASCPKEYETYIKNLVKIGGILVMPLNGKLQRMTRIGESTWSTIKITSVSFTTLITPPALTEHEHAKYTKLDSICPPKLEHICRSNIRTILKKNIDKDYPNLKNKQRRLEIKQVRRISSLDESDLSISDFEYDSDRSEFTLSYPYPETMSIFLRMFFRKRAELQAFNEALEMQSDSSSSDNDIQACNDKENGREDPNNKAISENKGNSKNETNSEDKANSEIKTKSESNTNSEKLTYSASFICMSEDSLDSDETLPSSSKKLTSDELKQTRNHTYLRSQIRSRRASAIQALKKRKLLRKRPDSDDQGASFISMLDHCLDSDESLPSSSKKLTSDELKQKRKHTYLRSQIRSRRASAIQALKKRKLSRKRPASDDQGASFISMSDHCLDSDESLPSSSKKLTSDELKQTRNHTYLGSQIRPRRASAIQALKKIKLSKKRPASDDQGASENQVISDCQIRARVKRGAPSIVWKHIIPRNSDSEREEYSKNDNIAKEKDNVEKDIEDDDIYTKHMIKRILSLPLPSRLIKYLNYERNNL